MKTARSIPPIKDGSCKDKGKKSWQDAEEDKSLPTVGKDGAKQQ